MPTSPAACRSGAPAVTTEFSDSQYALAYPDGIEHHWWNRARSWIILRLLRLYTSADSPVVEVGCGRGVEVMSLSRAGVDIRGVELAPVAPLPQVADRVQTGMDARELPGTDRSAARTMLLLDVIEHLPDPAEFLTELMRHYPQLATVVVTVPARQELWSNYDEFYGHQRRYTLEDLRQFGNASGLVPVSSGYFFQSLYLPARLLVLLGRNRETRIRPPLASARKFHRLIAWWFHLEHVLLPRRLRGSSAYAVYAVR